MSRIGFLFRFRVPLRRARPTLAPPSSFSLERLTRPQAPAYPHPGRRPPRAIGTPPRPRSKWVGFFAPVHPGRKPRHC